MFKGQPGNVYTRGFFHPGALLPPWILVETLEGVEIGISAHDLLWCIYLFPRELLIGSASRNYKKNHLLFIKEKCLDTSGV